MEVKKLWTDAAGNKYAEVEFQLADEAIEKIKTLSKEELAKDMLEAGWTQAELDELDKD